MKNRIKRIVLISAFIMLLSVFFIFNAGALSETGNCGKYGDNVTWSYNAETKELVISGSGEMKDYKGRRGNLVRGQ